MDKFYTNEILCVLKNRYYITLIILLQNYNTLNSTCQFNDS